MHRRSLGRNFRRACQFGTAVGAMLLSSAVSAQNEGPLTAKVLSSPLPAGSVREPSAHTHTYLVPTNDAMPGLPMQFDLRNNRSTALEMVSEVRALRRGLGIDVGLPDSGNFHLNLYSGRDVWGRGGQRWAPMSFDDEAPFKGRLWSVGASLDLVRFRSLSEEAAPDSRFVVSPQLRLDMDALTGMPGKFDLLIQDTPWRGPDNRAVDDERVVQVTLKWRF